MKNRINHEAIEQSQLFLWASFSSIKYPELELLYHVPNGGSRNALEAVNLKRQGVKSGVPDLCLPVPRGKYHGLYIELKAGKNKASQKQREWLRALREQNYAAMVCYGCDEAIEVITQYLNLK